MFTETAYWHQDEALQAGDLLTNDNMFALACSLLFRPLCESRMRLCRPLRIARSRAAKCGWLEVRQSLFLIGLKHRTVFDFDFAVIPKMGFKIGKAQPPVFGQRPAVVNDFEHPFLP